MKYLTTDHAIQRTKQRRWITTNKKAKKACIVLFRKLYNLFKKKEKYKWRKIKMCLWKWINYKITDWKHKFIFIKLIWEILIVTYAKKNVIDKMIHSTLK